MKQSFVYREKMSFSYFYPAIAFFVIAALCWYFGYGIAIRNLRLLAYPNSIYVMAIIGVLFLVSALRKWKRAKDSQKNPNPVTVDEAGFSFPYKSGKTVVPFADITGVRTDSSSDDGDSFIITAGGKDYEFFEERFEDSGHYAEFIDVVKKNVVQ